MALGSANKDLHEDNECHLSTLNCKVVAFGDNRWGQPVDTKIDTVENMATAYITEILKIQSSGQYNLAGWSFGGYLALEVAQQLEARGKEVRVVIMADSNIWNEDQVAASKKQPKWRPALDHLLTVVNDKNAWLSQFCRVKNMVARYRVSRGKFRGRVVLFKALRGHGIGELVVREDSHNGWREYLPQVEVRNVDVTQDGEWVADGDSDLTITRRGGRLKSMDLHKFLLG
jgi:thioesterase domain-containing protein